MSSNTPQIGPMQNLGYTYKGIDPNTGKSEQDPAKLNEVVGNLENFNDNQAVNINQLQGSDIFNAQAAGDATKRDAQKSALTDTYGFSANEAEMILNVMDVDGSDGISNDEYNASMQAFQNHGVGGDDGYITPRELINYAADADIDTLAAIDSEVGAALSAVSANSSQDELAAAGDMLDSQGMQATDQAELQVASGMIEQTDNSAETQAADGMIEQIDGSAETQAANAINQDKFASYTPQADENGRYLLADTFDAQQASNLDCAARITRNLNGVEYETKEGQDFWKKILEANSGKEGSAITGTSDEQGNPIILAGGKIYLPDDCQI